MLSLKTAQHPWSKPRYPWWKNKQRTYYFGLMSDEECPLCGEIRMQMTHFDDGTIVFECPQTTHYRPTGRICTMKIQIDEDGNLLDWSINQFGDARVPLDDLKAWVNKEISSAKFKDKRV